MLLLKRLNKHSNLFRSSCRRFCFVTDKAPDFQAQGVDKNNEIVDVYLSSIFEKKKYCCLLFYPLNFTFVCPTEIIEFNKNLKKFEDRKVEVLGISVDSVYSHLAWKHMPVEKGGIGPIRFTLLSDITKSISKKYGVLYKDSFALRGLFLIDTNGIIRHKTVNDLPLGRNVQEVIRTIDSIQHVDISGHVCPSNWKKGEDSFKPDMESLKDYLQKKEITK